MNNRQEYIISGIPFQAIDRFWVFAEPYVKRALDHTNGEMTHIDLKEMCISRDAQLWLCNKGNRIIGAGTTEIVIYPRKKVCRIITLAGTEFDGWMDLAHNVITLWAKDQGCESLQALTRTGFVQKLKKIGFRNRYCVCDKPI